MARVYELQLPGSLQAGTRAAEYVSRYAANRAELWQVAMDEARRRLDVDDADFAERVALAEATRDAILQQIQSTEALLADIQSGAIDREVARNRRNVDRRNASREFVASATNAAQRASAPSTTTTTTTPATTPAAPSPYPTPAEFEEAYSAIEGEAMLEVARRALADVRFSSGSSATDLQQQTSAALQALQAGMGAATGSRVNPAQVDLLRSLVREGVNERFASARPDITVDDARALQVATDPATSTEYDTIYSISGRTDADGAGAGGGTRTSVTSRAAAPVTGYTPEMEGPVDLTEETAAIEARLAELRRSLEAVDLPEREVRSLVDTAREEYRRLFGADRLRSRRGPGAEDYERLLEAVSTLGAEEVIRRAQPPELPASVRAGLGYVPPPVPRVRDTFQDEEPVITPEDRDTSARLDARVRGAELARSGAPRESGAMGRVVSSLYQSRAGAPLSTLEDEIIRTYTGDDQRRALELLHSFAVLEAESTLAGASDA